MQKLSIVILNFNTKELTQKCVDSIIGNTKGISYEIVVVDNGSDEKIPKSKNYKLIESNINLGFAGGNNLARNYVKGEYVLFLNSDTEVYKDSISECLKYFELHDEIGALTCKTVLPNGKPDRDARRSFPTPFVALTHFSGLDKVFPKSKIFAKYWYGYKSPDEIQEVDAIQGAFFLVKKETLDKVDWFSEEYFLDGEDIDLSFKIKSLGKEIIYYPKVSILHIKKASKKKRSLKSKMAGVNSMEIFYKKFLWQRYDLILNLIVVFAIYLLKTLRFGKAIIGR
ncbi:MAG TPA: glycosyltransferase family 2 protein [Patescibacteria group bacterium]|nr:glycosyltransferase family 2 protein [Patescibacteria group bacterium]